jgi:hypothetical protein
MIPITNASVYYSSLLAKTDQATVDFHSISGVYKR